MSKNALIMDYAYIEDVLAKIVTDVLERLTHKRIHKRKPTHLYKKPSKQSTMRIEQAAMRL
jgi:hypothetical protein